MLKQLFMPFVSFFRDESTDAAVVRIHKRAVKCSKNPTACCLCSFCSWNPQPMALSNENDAQLGQFAASSRGSNCERFYSNTSWKGGHRRGQRTFGFACKAGWEVLISPFPLGNHQMNMMPHDQLITVTQPSIANKESNGAHFEAKSS